jgi:hypothetical protein
MSSSRPLYIPPAKRKRPERFHGAFTGGFSAGYFNTVDTKEGWTPSTDKKASQSREDFMDDQDHDEWGGPTNVRQDYQTQEPPSTSRSKPTSKPTPQASTPTSLSLESLLTISHQTVGPRLLRILGWREGAGTAFVPRGEDYTNTDKPQDKDDELLETKLFISKRKLRKIQLQSSRITLPPPKLDKCGLGFEAHENAPEFRRYKEQRQELARARARGERDVYRTSTVSGNSNNHNHKEDEVSSRPRDRDGHNDYLSYETPEDFVGKRSASGFALRDDEDDAYDAGHGVKPSQLGDEYHTEIYEPEESDEDDDSHHPHAHAHPTVASMPSTQHAKPTRSSRQHSSSALSSVLASWAGGTTGTKTATSVGLTSDGRPPVAGFHLGGSMEAHKQRYPGPDLPREYELKRHVFGEYEHPSIFQTIARAVQLQAQDQVLQQRQRQQERHAETTMTKVVPRPNMERPSQPLTAGNQFANLATAMKNRFTKSSPGTTVPPERIGLYLPPPVQLPPMVQGIPVKPSTAAPPQPQPPNEHHHQPQPPPNEQQQQQPKPILIQRTVQPFLPHPMVCKRFGVSPPRNVVGAAFLDAPTRLTEAVYFEKEVLSTARGDQLEQTSNKTKTTKESPSWREEETNEDRNEDEPATGIQRPAMDKLKSIFEPTSDTSEESNDTDLDSVQDKHENAVIMEPPNPKDATTVTGPSAKEDSQLVVFDETTKSKDDSGTLVPKDSQMVDYESSGSSDSSSDSSHRKEKRKRKHKHKKSRRKRSRSPEDDDRRRKKERRRKHHKHKKQSSGRKKRDKEPKVKMS